MRTRVLTVHAGYGCRHTGACCSSGWEIPIEPTVEDALRAALRAGRLRSSASEVGPEADAPADRHFRPVAGLPHAARVLLGNDAGGRCVFLEGRGGGRCAIHRQLGSEALPSACRDFPRVVTLSPLGVSITLSHYCPTAAALLFRDGPPPSAPELPSGADPLLAIETDSPAFPPERPYEGLDAREALPPLLRPDVLMDWPSLERWERHAVSVLADEALTPASALELLAGAAEEARRWAPERGRFGAFFESVLDRWRDRRSAGAPSSPAGGSGPDPFPGRSGDAALEAWHLVADTVPHRERLPAAPEDPAAADERWVAPAWASLGRPIRRWLAAKAFGSWLALQGEGLRTCVAGLRLALAVLRAEAARQCVASRRPLDQQTLREAVRRADLLLVHLADPLALAHRLSRGEVTGAAGSPW